MTSAGDLGESELRAGWHQLGIVTGDVLMVHASLSALGMVAGGAPAVVDSLRTAVGEAGTLVMPAFTPHISDPEPQAVGVPSVQLQLARDAVPFFVIDTPSSMGAIAEHLRKAPGTQRSQHPQVSVIAQGPDARDIVNRQPLGYAVGSDSPFGIVRALGGKILLIGVGHNRNTFLHHAESLSPLHRRKLRRFPRMVEGERVWIEAPDVADDLDTLFPVIGAEFEAHAGIRPITVGSARCRLLDVEAFVAFCVSRFDDHLGTGTAP